MNLRQPFFEVSYHVELVDTSPRKRADWKVVERTNVEVAKRLLHEGFIEPAFNDNYHMYFQITPLGVKEGKKI